MQPPFSHPLIEHLLDSWRNVIGVHFEKYRNHVYRVYSNCILLDPDNANAEKYAIAAVFHDLGIWTDHTIDYLEPSVKQASIYLKESDKEDWLEEISMMIGWHHKLCPYKGAYGIPVENFRKADWIDVSFGLLSFGLDKRAISQSRRELPNCGFHLFLLKSVLGNLLKHPLKPLPMFRL